MDDAARIVVGIDGSEGSLRALDAARQEAALRGAAVEAVVAWDFLDQPGHRDQHPFDPHFDQGRAEAWLTEVLGPEVLGGDPPVTPRAIRADPADALVQAGEGADLLVVGARGHGPFTGALLGSVSQKVLHRAPCPVLVARGSTPLPPGAGDERPVVVGVDGSEPSRAALRWAADEARHRSVRLVAVHGWDLPSTAAAPLATGFALPPAEAFADGARALVDAEVADLDAGPDLEVETRSDGVGATRALLDAAEDAALLVVGTRGRGGFAGLVLGSISQQVAHHAPCPVVVVPERG